MTSQEINKIKTYFEKKYDETNRNITLFLIKKCKNFSDIKWSKCVMTIMHLLCFLYNEG